MRYRVLRRFSDKFDDYFVYEEGDEFPRDGVIVPKERIKELSGRANQIGEPLIEAVKEKRPPQKKTEE